MFCREGLQKQPPLGVRKQAQVLTRNVNFRLLPEPAQPLQRVSWTLPGLEGETPELSVEVATLAKLRGGAGTPSGLLSEAPVPTLRT